MMCMQCGQKILKCIVFFFLALELPEEKYRVWLRERYADCRTNLLDLLHHENNSVQVGFNPYSNQMFVHLRGKCHNSFPIHAYIYRIEIYYIN